MHKGFIKMPLSGIFGSNISLRALPLKAFQRRCLWKPPVPQGHFLRAPFEKSWAKTLTILFPDFLCNFKICSFIKCIFILILPIIYINKNSERGTLIYERGFFKKSIDKDNLIFGGGRSFNNRCGCQRI